MSIILEATKRRLEQQYPPNLPLEIHQPQNHSNSSSHLGQNLPAAPETPPRGLPSRAVSDDNFDDVYVSFIMHCNPTIPLDTDTSDLRRIFRAPPKSDGKSFSTFTLFKLIQKLELKEIKTWAQLAVDLGVEPPALDKGQSAQKVQQYAVRLKRWMHAMHVDAFFEYLLNKAHVYWTQIPSINDSASELGRDGVVPEEDLALRALLPELLKPRRGRRKNEDRDDGELSKSPSQRPRIESPTLSEDFMIARASMVGESQTPATAHPLFQQNYEDRLLPWSATEMRGQLGGFRWPPQDTHNPLTAYPQSAITPTNRSLIWNEEPGSAITPKPRYRRRHRPAVSSAWLGNGSSPSGKLRGRPPSNCSVIDGSFSTFPANPTPRDVPTINLRDNTATPTPITANSEIPQFFPASVQANPPKPLLQTSRPSRPSRLQLQVPQREGGSVRLATPPPAPPVLLVNGEANTHIQNPVTNHQQLVPLMEYFNSPVHQDPSHTHYVSIAFRQNEDTDRINMDALESHFICEILAADWYNAIGENIERCSIDEADKICKQVIENLQTESSSTETFLINLSALAGGPLMSRLRMMRIEQGNIAHYECHWKMRFGSLEGDFTIKATVHHAVDSAVLEQDDDVDESWKKKYLDLQQRIKDRDKKVGNLKRGVLDALVVSNRYAMI